MAIVWWKTRQDTHTCAVVKMVGATALRQPRTICCVIYGHPPPFPRHTHIFQLNPINLRYDRRTVLVSEPNRCHGSRGLCWAFSAVWSKTTRILSGSGFQNPARCFHVIGTNAHQRSSQTFNYIALTDTIAAQVAVWNHFWIYSTQRLALRR